MTDADLLLEARDLLHRLGDEFAPNDTWWTNRAHWLLSYAQREQRVMLVKIVRFEEETYSWSPVLGPMKIFKTSDDALADARCVAESLGLKCEVET